MSGTLLAELRANTAGVRAAAVQQLRFVQLKDPSVLAAVLDLCADDTVLTLEQSGDPFAAFFAPGDEQRARTVGDEAVDRLDRAGLPRDAWEALRDALERHRSHPRLLGAVARWTAETRWSDAVRALEVLLPPLQEADLPLLGIVARAEGQAVDVLVRRALSPFNARTLQELLNHAATQQNTIAAIEARVTEAPDAFDAPATMLVLGLLTGWESPAAPRLASAWRAAHPWAVAYEALSEPAAIPDLDAWMNDAAAAAPAEVGARVVEVLRQRPRVDGWPLSAWVRRFGLAAESFEPWGCDAEAIDLLRERVLMAEKDPIEAWNAAVLLVADAAHAPVLPNLNTMCESLPWDGDLWVRLAGAKPPIKGLLPAIVRGLREGLDANPAMQVADELSTDDLKNLLPALLDSAEKQPHQERPAGPGLVRIGRVGVDDARLLTWATAIGDADMVRRARALEPLVRAKG